jgi:hypothetical protein
VVTVSLFVASFGIEDEECSPCRLRLGKNIQTSLRNIEDADIDTEGRAVSLLLLLIEQPSSDEDASLLLSSLSLLLLQLLPVVLLMDECGCEDDNILVL